MTVTEMLDQLAGEQPSNRRKDVAASTPTWQPSASYQYLREQARPCVYLMGADSHDATLAQSPSAHFLDEFPSGRVALHVDLNRLPNIELFLACGAIQISLDFDRRGSLRGFDFTQSNDAGEDLGADRGHEAPRRRTILTPIDGLALPWGWPDKVAWDEAFPEKLHGEDLCWMATKLCRRVLEPYRPFQQLVTLGGLPFGDDNCAHWIDEGCIQIAELDSATFGTVMYGQQDVGGPIRFFVDEQPLPVADLSRAWFAA
ncbi:hypothetical protein [Rubinisphaera brasiliensis]|uniref:Uncharacterized protein n=1 Tax=Rubinisphaera brasiliensis (strain ATCC 49424 / DSM 5305 / JCM 21570 / IAM 15109 / NBRC 103401 / IFAM 1448) TaxID=756272 RepID=F0SR58_RUBBR|nr:hypothetical protein [Rubinisphaera brasiliensis]ADY61305.1 hypothetical protein Plabr_3712 [Rubinisphaera brasiliensis DSM 5305]